MKIKKNGKVINLTEGDLNRIVKRVLNEDIDMVSDKDISGIYPWDDVFKRVNMKRYLNDTKRYCLRKVRTVDQSQNCLETIDQIRNILDAVPKPLGGYDGSDNRPEF